jgi:uncharacterized protein RhaS with RHS repeats
VLRRFLSADPLGVDGGLNLYAYANGDPLAYIDALGLCTESTTEKFFDYLGSSINQIVKGNYTDDVTALGTVGSVGLGLLGADLPMDIRDITYDFTHWEWSWSHVGQTTLDAVSVLPLVGVLKYTDEVTALSKGGEKASVLSGRAIDKGNTIRRSSGPIIKTSTEARSIARMKGWTEVHGIKSSRKEVIFTDGRRFYTRDNTGHKGGVWKEVDRNGIRIRTLDGNLNPIGD